MDHSKEFTRLLARFAISIPKEKYDMRKKQRGMILFSSNLSYFLGGSFPASRGLSFLPRRERPLLAGKVVPFSTLKYLF